MSGIYKITNKINGKVYVGRTTRAFVDRWKEHKEQLNNDTHANTQLQRDWSKYGADNFSFFVTEEISDLKEIPLAEYRYISMVAEDNCYNKIYRKAHNTIMAISLLLKDKNLRVYLECNIQGINWSMIVKDLKQNKVYYFVQNLKNKNNIKERESFISQSDRRVLIDIPKPIRNYHCDSKSLYEMTRGDNHASIL
jgi:group I intron endonuclease